MQKWEYRELSHSHHELEDLRDAGIRKKVGKVYEGPEEGWYWHDGITGLNIELAEMGVAERLSALGAEGWECFSVVTSGYYSQTFTFYFKRPLPE